MPVNEHDGRPPQPRRERPGWLLLENLLFTLVVPGTVAVYVPLLLAPDEPGGSTLARALAVAALVVGVAIYGWCVWDFASFGRGTPAPIDAPKRLVVRGLYRYSRNPMYVGVLTVIVGWMLWFQAASLVLYFVVVWTGFHLFVIGYEEPRLRAEFADTYETYCAEVGRWLPRFGRPKAV